MLRDLQVTRTLHQGWLLKEGGVLRTVWHRRWCVLQPEGIYYFRSNTRELPEPDERASGLIPISGASVRWAATRHAPHTTRTRRVHPE